MSLGWNVVDGNSWKIIINVLGNICRREILQSVANLLLPTIVIFLLANASRLPPVLALRSQLHSCLACKDFTATFEQRFGGQFGILGGEGEVAAPNVINVMGHVLAFNKRSIARSRCCSTSTTFSEHT